MSLRARIEALVQAAPPDGTVPVRWLGQLLREESDEPTAPTETRLDGIVDLSVTDLAQRFRKGPSTIRAWLESGAFPGAYKLNGKEWRVPLDGVIAMQRAQADQQSHAVQREASE